MASSGTETVPMACTTAKLLHAAAAAAAVDKDAGDSALHDAATLAVSLSSGGGVGGGESTPARTGSTPQVTPQQASELAVSTTSKKAGDFSRLVSATNSEKGGGKKAKGKKAGGGPANRRKGGTSKGQTVTFKKADGEGGDSAAKSGTASVQLEPRVTPASDFGAAAPATAGGDASRIQADAAAPASDFLSAQISPVRSSARRAEREARKRKEEEDERRRRQVEELAAATTSSSPATAPGARRNTPPPSERKGRPPATGNKLTSPKMYLTPRTPATMVQAQGGGAAVRPGPTTGLTPTNFASDFGKVSQDMRLTEYEESNGEYTFGAD